MMLFYIYSERKNIFLFTIIIYGKTKNKRPDMMVACFLFMMTNIIEKNLVDKAEK